MVNNNIDLGIVVTSIFDNNWLERIFNQLEKEELLDSAKIYFIADNKTPSTVFSQAKALADKGLKIWIPHMSEQKEYCSSLNISSFILENSDHRRNIGFLKCIEDDVKYLLSMDDDNFPLTNNFFHLHKSSLGEVKNLEEIKSSNNFFNNCMLLKNDTFIHPRGFPFNRKRNNEYTFEKIKNKNIGVNAGLWSISPDVDGFSWLISHEEILVDSVDDICLSSETYCPINTQNTSLIKELIPAYYYIRMGFDIGGGLKFDRLGDIYSGYFLQKVAKTMNYGVKFGMPVVTHERNAHNYINDANAEWGCMRTMDTFCDWLVDIKLDNSSVNDAYLSLSDELDVFANKTKFQFMSDQMTTFFVETSQDMKRWLTTLSILEK